MTIKVGYSIPDISSLRAISASEWINGYARLVLSDASEETAWFTFLSASTATPDNKTAITPDDNPAAGRWIKTSGTGGGVNLPGNLVCGYNDGECNIGGKAFRFFSPFQGEVIVTPSFGINVSSYWEDEFNDGNENRDKSIELHRWSQEPNFDMNGREFVANIPRSGGSANLVIDSQFQWISIFASNPDEFDSHDATCFVVSGNVISLVDFY